MKKIKAPTINKTSKVYKLIEKSIKSKNPRDPLRQLKDNYLVKLGFDVSDTKNTGGKFLVNPKFSMPKNDDEEKVKYSVSGISEVLRSYLNAVKSFGAKHHTIGGKQCPIAQLKKHLSGLIPTSVIETLKPSDNIKDLRNAYLKIKKDYSYKGSVKIALQNVKLEPHAYLLIAPCYAYMRELSNKQQRGAIDKKLNSIMRINKTFTLDWATRILKDKKSSYQLTALALIAVTGRRSTEIIKTGNFTKTNKSNSVLFDGQLKLKNRALFNEVGTYEIPVLVDSSLVITSINRLRKLLSDVKINFSDVTGKLCEAKVNAVKFKDCIQHNKGINNYFAETLRLNVKREFDCTDMKPSLLRAAYTEIGFTDFANDGESRTAYRVRVLGHGDMGSQANYDYFELSSKVSKAAPAIKKVSKLEKSESSELLELLQSKTSNVYSNTRAKGAHRVHEWAIKMLKSNSIDKSQLSMTYLRQQFINGKLVGASGINKWYELIGINLS